MQAMIITSYQNVESLRRVVGALSKRALRFSIWDEPARGLPALLGSEDLARMDASGCLFARKVDADTPLFDELERRWLGQ